MGSEIKHEPLLEYDHSGNAIYSFTTEHSIMDVIRWLVSENFEDLDDLIFFLKTAYREESGDGQ